MQMNWPGLLLLAQSIIVPPNEGMRRAAALDELSGDAVRATRMGSAAAARARTHYSAEAAVDALESLYLRLVAGKTKDRELILADAREG